MAYKTEEQIAKEAKEKQERTAECDNLLELLSGYRRALQVSEHVPSGHLIKMLRDVADLESRIMSLRTGKIEELTD